MDLTAYRDQHDSIRAEFRRQAPSWVKEDISPDLRWVLTRLDLHPRLEVLDVAAGTGLLSRGIAPHVQRVVAMDITPEMLEHGRAEATRQGITNISWEQGVAEELTYPTESFDMVVTRFSMHHLKSPEIVAREMCRVCRRGGTLVLIDLAAPEDEELAARYNHLEKLRDSSHTRALSSNDLVTLAENAGVEAIRYYSRDVRNSVDTWLDFTRADAATRQQIIAAMQRELRGGEKMGMRPFISEGHLMFMHTWGIVVGSRRSEHLGASFPR